MVLTWFACTRGTGRREMSKQVASKPEGWQETVGGVKQTCWCGKEWDEGHEDAAAHVHGASEQEQVVKSESEEE